MSCEVPVGARELAGRLAVLFGSDSRLAERLNDAQGRLLDANDRLWSGLHPDALGLVYDGAHRVAIAAGESALATQMGDVSEAGGGKRDAQVLRALQQTHWAIWRAFCDYQSACEERRQLAVDVGELAQQLTEALVAAGWSEDAAASADVCVLAAGGRR